MGIFSWLVAALLAFILGRFLPPGRTPRRLGELFIAVIAALAGGVAASRLDFGGWAVFDVRATLFSFFTALAAVALLRGFQSLRGRA